MAEEEEEIKINKIKSSFEPVLDLIFALQACSAEDTFLRNAKTGNELILSCSSLGGFGRLMVDIYYILCDGPTVRKKGADLPDDHTHSDFWEGMRNEIVGGSDRINFL